VWWHVQSRGKKSSRSIAASRRTAIARKLALAADIVVENFRPALGGMGLGYDALAAATRLVMVRISVTARPVPTASGRASA